MCKYIYKKNGMKILKINHKNVAYRFLSAHKVVHSKKDENPIFLYQL